MENLSHRSRIKNKSYGIFILIIFIFSIITINGNSLLIQNPFKFSKALATNNSIVEKVLQNNYSNNLISRATDSSNNLTISKDLTTGINQKNAPNTDNFNITNGYTIKPILWNLTLASTVTFDDRGNTYISEAGYAPDGLEATPRILKIDPFDRVSILVDRDLYGPITDMEYHDGQLYVSNRAKISTVDAETGVVKDIIVGLPSLGDYSNNQIAFGPDGRLYFGQGTATNSGVIGEDNYGWLKLMPIIYGIPYFHDVPAKDLKLTGSNFKSKDILTLFNSTDTRSTGAFVPFGNKTKENQIIHGDNKCNGCIISTKPDGSDLKVIGWGLRNPQGLAFDINDSNTLYITNEGAEERGSRPIANDMDKIYGINASSILNIVNSNVSSNSDKKPVIPYFGWPDYFGNAEPVTTPKFQSNTSKESLSFLTKDHSPVQKPKALINDSAKISQITFSTNNSTFGYKGMAFISEFGDLGQGQEINSSNNSTTNVSSALVNKSMDGFKNSQDVDIKGQKIILFDPKNKTYKDFISLKNADPSFRPIDVSFNPNGSALYITSLSKAEIRNTIPEKGFPLTNPTPWYYKHTGVLWKVTNSTSDTLTLSKDKQKQLQLIPELKSKINSGPPPTNMTKYLNIPSGYKMEPVLWNLDLPGSFAFDKKGNVYFASTGITYGKVSTTPSIYKIDKNGTVSLLADRPLHGILSDIEFNENDGLLYVAHRNLVSTVNTTTGEVKDILVGLPVPAYVTHPLGQLAIGPDKRIYISIGGLSNTAVPDISDWGIGWIRDMPFMHEIPGQNITLTGQNFMSDNFITSDPKDKTVTGGMMSFGTPSFEGQKVKGDSRCTSCIISINPDGSDLRLHAWGIRNAYGMIFDEKGMLFMASNGDDDKGIRRNTYDPDSVFVLDPKQSNITYFGWPDYPSINKESIGEPKFNESPKQSYFNKPLIADPPTITTPFLELGMSVGNSQAAYSTNEQFGFKGKIFVGEFGTIAPVTHIFHKPNERDVSDIMGKIIGQKIVIVDPNTRTLHDFISLKNPVASFRPVGLGFTPDGSVLYLASIEKEQERMITPKGGVLSTTTDYPFLGTGTIWKIIKILDNNTETKPAEQSLNLSNTSKTGNTSLTAPYGGINSSQIWRENMINEKKTLNTNTSNFTKLPIEVNASIVKGAALLKEYAFNPNPIIIKKGGTVTWTNDDSVTHTITFGYSLGDPKMGKEFDSGMLGKSFTHTFKKTGEFPYLCQVHPTMKGMVIVK